VVEIAVPTIIPVELFESVKRRLSQNNPKVTPPRIVNGPTLLTGLAICASCGAGMTRTGTRRRDRFYSYYSCGGCHQKGKSVCAGRHIPMSKLDDLVIANVKECLFTPKRLEIILEGLAAMQASKDCEVQKRRAALEADLANTNDKLSRLYRAIEDDIVELDRQLKDRIKTLKTQRDIVVATLERMVAQARTNSAITPDRLQNFSRLMQEKLDTGDIQAKKAYLRSVISQIEVGDDKVRIIGEKASLAAVIAGSSPPETARVRGFVRKWRARRDSNP
jgi:hypothetical protein